MQLCRRTAARHHNLVKRGSLQLGGLVCLLCFSHCDVILFCCSIVMSMAGTGIALKDVTKYDIGAGDCFVHLAKALGPPHYGILREVASDNLSCGPRCLVAGQLLTKGYRRIWVAISRADTISGSRRV